MDVVCAADGGEDVRWDLGDRGDIQVLRDDGYSAGEAGCDHGDEECGNEVLSDHGDFPPLLGWLRFESNLY